jgi:hypothetical protein
MSFDFPKLFRNVDIRLRGRTALVACGLAVLALMFWVVLRDYGSHRLLSTVVACTILLAVMAALFIGLLGRTRPEEVAGKLTVQVGPFGTIFTSGAWSQPELVELLRELGGAKQLPAPAARTDGPASEPQGYRELSAGEAEALAAEVERGVEALIAQQAQKLLAQMRAALPSPPSRLQIEGGDEPPKD